MIHELRKGTSSLLSSHEDVGSRFPRRIDTDLPNYPPRIPVDRNLHIHRRETHILHKVFEIVNTILYLPRKIGRNSSRMQSVCGMW
jgi:hypothetical protein